MLFPLPSRRPKADCRPRICRPRLEILEDRTLLSVYTVDRLTDTGAGTALTGDLRYCLTQAIDGDSIQFGVQGTINLTGALPNITHSIAIEGPGADLLTVRRDSGGNYRIFKMASGTTVSISGLTIANGNVVNDYGGGIYSGGALTISNCTISGNSSLNLSPVDSLGGIGGGIYSFATLIVSNCIINNNSALNTDQGRGNTEGGGIYSFGTLTISNSSISNNSVSPQGGDGGAIYDFGSLTLDGSTVSNNYAGITVSYLRGGTVLASNCTFLNNITGQACIEGNGPLTITNCTIRGNAGYGIWNGSGTATINSSTVADNTGYGFRNNDTLIVTNSTIAGNTWGGIQAVAFRTPAVTMLLNCTLADNGGNQILCTYGVNPPQSTATVRFRNTILAGNGTAANLATNFSGGMFSSQGHNLSDDSGSGFLTGPGDLANTDPMLGPVQDNGGPTPTMALLVGSPAIDAGDNTGVPATDQRGFPRVVNGTVDIGAFEVQPAVQATHLGFQAPGSVVAGTPFAITVTALNDFGQQTAGYGGTVHFTFSPTGYALDYTFTSADAGQHIFSGLVLDRAQADGVSGADTATPPIGGSVAFTVTPADAAHLAFTLASGVTVGVPFSITVTVQDAYGNTVTGYTGTVHFQLIGPELPAADYTFTAADMGSHTFGNLLLDQPGTYTLTGADTADPVLSGVLLFTVSA